MRPPTLPLRMSYIGPGAAATMARHLFVGDELVKAGRWPAALPHFLHPTEEINGDLRDQLKDYNVPPFELTVVHDAQGLMGRGLYVGTRAA